MTLNAKMLENIILEGLPDAQVRIEDLRGDGESHYATYVTSPAFDGKTRVEQHQMIYAILKGRMDTETQIISLHTSVPKR
jgi:stress-induced morphogen